MYTPDNRPRKAHIKEVVTISTAYQAQQATRIHIMEPEKFVAAIAEYLAVMQASTFPSVIINSDERIMFAVDVNSQPCPGYVGAVHPQPFAYSLTDAVIHIGVFIPMDVDPRLISPDDLPERTHDAAPLVCSVRILTDNLKQGRKELDYLDYEVLDSRLRHV